jgi:hypothetical protein
VLLLNECLLLLLLLLLLLFVSLSTQTGNFWILPRTRNSSVEDKERKKEKKKERKEGKKADGREMADEDDVNAFHFAILRCCCAYLEPHFVMHFVFV